MKLKQIRSLIIVAIFAAAGLVGIVQSESYAITTTTTTTSDSRSSGRKYVAKMTSDQEVPPIHTEILGTIKLVATKSQQQNVLDYLLTVINLNGTITGVDIHIGKQGINGPIVAASRAAVAAASSSSGARSTMTSSLVIGTITNVDLRGPLEGKQISDLVKLIEESRTYANVSTEQYPKGEIRGQLSPSNNREEEV